MSSWAKTAALAEVPLGRRRHTAAGSLRPIIRPFRAHLRPFVTVITAALASELVLAVFGIQAQASRARLEMALEDAGEQIDLLADVMKIWRRRRRNDSLSRSWCRAPAWSRCIQSRR